MSDVRRRSILRMLAASVGMLPLRPLQAWAQTVNFPGAQTATLEALAFIVLPASLGREGIRREVARFEGWVRNYREGADTDHGYGHTRVVPLPVSPAPIYMRQLEELQAALAAGDDEKARAAILESLNRSDVRDLTPGPRGKNIVADLMSFYFRSSEANDLCYQAAIQRYECRGVAHSEVPPPPLTKSS
jgi:hypothetical protein